MEKIFLANKKLINLIMIPLVIGMLLCFINMILFKYTFSVFWCFLVLNFFNLFVINEYSSKLYINYTGLINYKDRNILLFWENIIRIEYQGSNQFPIFEKIIIRGVVGKIEINYFYKDYLSVWREVIDECKLHNSDIIIDERIKKRLSEHEAKKNIT